MWNAGRAIGHTERQQLANVQPNKQSENTHNYLEFSYSGNQLQLCSNMYTTEMIGYITRLIIGYICCLINMH